MTSRDTRQWSPQSLAELFRENFSSCNLNCSVVHNGKHSSGKNGAHHSIELGNCLAACFPLILQV